jgi:hypothetical protein
MGVKLHDESSIARRKADDYAFQRENAMMCSMDFSHVKIAVLALLCAGVLAIPTLLASRLQPLAPTEMNVAVEHEKALMLLIRRTIGSGSGLVEFKNGAGTGIALSVPTDWTRVEVRGAALTQASSDALEFGFTRWHLPSLATIVFETPTSPDLLRLHNPSETPIHAEVTRVDARTQKATFDSVLVSDHPLLLP